FEVLEELSVAGRSLITVFNKADRLPGSAKLAELLAQTKDSLSMSSLTGAGLEHLFDAIEKKLAEGLSYGEYSIPYEQAGVVSDIREIGQVVDEHYTEAGICLRVRLPSEFARRWAEFRTSSSQ
ncbi:MAG: hypothetical protein GX316_09240, partial [Firmicutes bacterium]|nr:hypothetical protein [Bacillota bacterium]